MTRRLRYVAGVVVVAGALLLAGCGGGGPEAVRPTNSETLGGSGSSGAAITISNFMFSPMHLSVSPGATVRVMNIDSTVHTLTATGGQFNTGDISHNQTKTFIAPMKPGTYNYICNIHQYMMGRITVR